MLAQKLSNNRDYGAEYLFSNIVKSIQKDTTMTALLNDYIHFKVSNQDELESYIKHKYFTGYWDKFDILITLCDSSKVLEILPEDYAVNCYDYFDKIVVEEGLKTDCDELFYIDSDYSVDNYLGIIEFPDVNIPVRINIEFFSRLIPRGLGYPELLNDQKNQSAVDLSLYSWARYEKGDLIYHFGKYSYSINLLNYQDSGNEKKFFNLNNYNHLHFPVDKSSTLIISRKNPGLIDIVAPFSYFFIFYGLLLFILQVLYEGPIILKISDISIKRRLQLFITALIILSFLFVGISSLFYITSLNNNKNQELLSEKAHSVLIEIEHKLAGEQNLTNEIQQYLSDLLYKFSMVFFSDINLYDLDGTLIATSRPEIFNKGLISTKMDPGAFYKMSINRNSTYIHNESIGDYKYLSAYLPFRNENNKLIAFLNLPYFAKQDELTNDISTYLVALINIYVILIALAILIALIVTKYVTKPVEMIKDKISRLKLGKTNEKIDWRKNDEIGGLVIEYNRMVDELALSAERLAKSERESAWREMAQQIAHEIKNPLTPMKLSVQYLQKAWDEKAPDWDRRLQRFTQTIVDQIESLSAIASEFSDFAKMPKSNFEKTELNRIIDHSISLFKDTTPIQFDLKSTGNHFVYADKEQLLRVFINLINNSIQAISNPAKGYIAISVETEQGYYLIRLTDNGKGIPNDQKHRVFYPNFTTKSGGTGLGLAIVKNIIQNSRGEISFESEEEKGTTFIIKLPAHND
jgi:signal transduction histidine kinase